MTYMGTAYVYDKDVGDWVTTPIDVAVGELVLVKIVNRSSAQGQVVNIYLRDSDNGMGSDSRVIPMGVMGHVSKWFYTDECYGAFVMYDDDVTVVDSTSGGVLN